MLGLSALNGGTPGAQSRLAQYKIQLQQARQDGERAQERVRQLEMQTDAARNEAMRANERAATLASQAPRETGSPAATSGRARQRSYEPAQRAGTLLDTTA